MWQEDLIMDKIVHQKITKATLKALNLEPDDYQLLLEASIEPDKQYEQAMERIRILENKKVEDIERRYESMPRDSLLDQIRTLKKPFEIGLRKYVISPLLERSPYIQWAIEHGPNAKDNAARYFQIAHESHENERLINLGYCLHYVADTGTPYHRKSLEELPKIPSGTSEGLESETVIKNLLKFGKSVIYDHKRFEKELSSFWDTRGGQSSCEDALNRGFELAKTNRPFTSFTEATGQFKATLADVENTAAYHCKNLDERFSGRPLGKELSQEDRKFILDTSLSCLVRIGEASYIATKAILSSSTSQS